jgi:hypothetical protein
MEIKEVTTMGETFTRPGPVREAPVGDDEAGADVAEIGLRDLARYEGIERAAREVLATWDRVLPEGVGIAFFGTLIDLRLSLDPVPADPFDPAA